MKKWTLHPLPTPVFPAAITNLKIGRFPHYEPSIDRALHLLDPATVLIPGQATAIQDDPARGDYQLPEFRTDNPKFCYLDFPAGQNQRQTILIAVDGERMYLDHDGDGDLSEPEGTVVATRREWESENHHKFTVSELSVGSCIHTSIIVIVQPLKKYDRGEPQYQPILESDPEANCYVVRARIEDARFTPANSDGRVTVSAGIEDVQGVLQFGDAVESAPTIRFAGVLESRLMTMPELRPGSEVEILTNIGTPGIGPGTFAAMGYEGVVPDLFHPNLELDVVTSESGDSETVMAALDRRC